MKKILNALFLTLLAVLTFSSCSDVPSPYDIKGKEDIQLTGEGTKEYPYDVASAKQKQDGSVAWVEGYIVGCLEDILENGEYVGSKANFTAPFNITSNILIAASPEETNESNCLPVKIKNGSDLSNALNLKDHPDNKGEHVSIQGELSSGFGKPALINTVAAVLKGQTIGEEQGGGGETGNTTITENQAYEVSFASDLAGFTVENKVNEGLAKDVWYYSKKYTAASASSYNGTGNVPAEGLFISPVLDMTAISKATLTFEHSSYSQGKSDELMLKAREANATEWTELTISNYSTSRDNRVTTTVDLTSFAQKKVQIAFHYKNEANGSNNTWYIYNLKVAAGEGGGELPSDDDPFGLDASNPKSTFIADFEEITEFNKPYSLEGWINKAIQASNVWQSGIYNDVDKYIKATPYKVDQNETMEAWFITPAFTVNSANKFTFDCAGANWIDDMTLKVFFLQKNASGVVTKEEITVSQIPTSGDDFEWVKDINVSLDNYNGKVGFIGFQYTVISTGAFSKLPTYQIDNVKYEVGEGGGEQPGESVELPFIEGFGEMVDYENENKTAIATWTHFDTKLKIVDTKGKADIRVPSKASTDACIWLPSSYSGTDNSTEIEITGFNAVGYTDLTLSYDLQCASMKKGESYSYNIIKVLCDGKAVTVPEGTFAKANTYYPISISNIPVGTKKITFVSDAGNTMGFRLDNIKLEGVK